VNPLVKPLAKSTAFLTAMACLTALCGCATHYADDPLVASARGLHRSVVLLTMNVPAEKKHAPPDQEYATGVVVASGKWGSDVLTVQHAVDHASDLHVTVDNKTKLNADVVAQDKDQDVALLRTREPNLPVAVLGSSKDLDRQLGRELGLLGYPVPDDFDDEGLDLATSLATGNLSASRNDAIEVTMPIVPGYSGGPIFLADTGEIIALADSRFDDERSIGFGVPIDDAKRFLHQYDGAHGF